MTINFVHIIRRSQTNESICSRTLSEPENVHRWSYVGYKTEEEIGK